MRHFGLAFMGAGLALASFSAMALFPFRQPDIPHRILDRKYSDWRSAFFAGPCGSQIHYRDEGRADGPPLVLVHGYCASLHTWEPWVERLAEHYRIVSIDLPGHGLTRTAEGYRIGRDSFAEIIDAAAEHLGLETFAIAGSSMGGAAAWDYAARRPEKVAALVLVGAAGFTPRPEQDFGEPVVLDLLRSPMGPVLRDLDATPMMRKGLKASFANPAIVGDAMIERYVALGRAPMHRNVQMQLALARSERIYATPEALARISAPTLVLHGEKDRLVPVGDGIRFATAIRDAQLMIYEDVGHILHEEIPEQSAEDVHAFLQGVLTGQGRLDLQQPAEAPAREERRAAPHLHLVA
ncbi:MAG: alpha/beta fold hydrolase [Hyphomonadaceae bacterium]|nr:alpha/beta fold hydrolase [Hyphomonadaceae bacterium]